MVDYSYQNIVILGDSKVGKSTIIKPKKKIYVYNWC